MEKVFTEKQESRLAAHGYWLHYYTGNNELTKQTLKRPDAVCIMNGRCTQVHHCWGTEWTTLLWSCAPTKRGVLKRDPEFKYEYFKTHEELLNAHPELLSTPIGIKATNDY